MFLFATAKAQWSEHLPGSGTAGPPAAAPSSPPRSILRPLRAAHPPARPLPPPRRRPSGGARAAGQRHGTARYGAACGSASRTHGTGGSARQLSARGGGTSRCAARPRQEAGEGEAARSSPGPPAPGPAAVRALRGRGAACRAAGRSLPLLCGGAAPCACGGAASRTQAAQGWPRNASGLGTGRSRAAMAPRLLLPPCCFSRFLRRRRRRASERDTGFENAARHPRDVPPPTRG